MRRPASSSSGSSHHAGAAAFPHTKDYKTGGTSTANNKTMMNKKSPQWNSILPFYNNIFAFNTSSSRTNSGGGGKRSISSSGHRPTSSCWWWKRPNKNLFSIIVIAITTILIFIIFTDTLVLFRSGTPTSHPSAAPGNDEDSSNPSLVVSPKERDRQKSLRFLRHQLRMEKEMLVGGNVKEMNGHSIIEKSTTKAAAVAPYPQTVMSFCPTEGSIPDSKDDDDNIVKGPVVDMSSLRQLSNRDIHSKDSKCPRNIQDTKIGTTLVTQSTFDRLPFLQETCQRWASPMIVVVCLSPAQVNSQDWDDVRERYYQLCPHLKMVPVAVDDMERDFKYPINRLRNRGLDEVETSHVLMIDVDFIPSLNLDEAILKAIQIKMEQEEEDQGYYRHNHQEHMDNSKSSMANVMNSSSQEVFHIKENQYHYHALVVPAFERKMQSPICQNITLEQCIQYTSMYPEFMPKSIDSLKQCRNSTKVTNLRDGNSDFDETPDLVATMKSSIDSSKCIVFHSDYFLKGHGDTKSAQWLNEVDVNYVRPISCINIDAYEPYLALPWCPSSKLNHHTLQSKVRITERGFDHEYYNNNTSNEAEPWSPLTPYYDERFYGYGKNKLQHIFHLQQTGYAFSVIPTMGFLTHHPHPDSTTKIHWVIRSRHYVDDQENVKVKMKRLYKTYKCEIEKEYKKLYPLPTDSC